MEHWRLCLTEESQPYCRKLSKTRTGRFTALDPLDEKGGDNDWYGYCLDDPINRADVWGLEDSWWDGPGGRIVRGGLKTAASWGVKGAVIGLPIDGVGALPAAATGVFLGLPYGMLKSTVEEIASPNGSAAMEAEKQSENTLEQREGMGWPGAFF